MEDREHGALQNKRAGSQLAEGVSVPRGGGHSLALAHDTNVSSPRLWFLLMFAVKLAKFSGLPAKASDGTAC